MLFVCLFLFFVHEAKLFICVRTFLKRMDYHLIGLGNGPVVKWLTEVTTCIVMFSIEKILNEGVKYVTLFGKSRLNENSVEAFFRCNAFSTH